MFSLMCYNRFCSLIVGLMMLKTRGLHNGIIFDKIVVEKYISLSTKTVTNKIDNGINIDINKYFRNI